MTAKRRIISVFVPHLGCPNNCVFCNQRRISGAVNPATADTVAAAIADAGLCEGDCTEWELAFYGGSFTAIEENYRSELLGAACDFVRRGGAIRLSTRPDCINESILDELKAAGVQTIELGCQSMDDEVLEKSGRGHTANDTVKAAKLIKKYGFSLILQMMTGLPGDTRDRAQQTARSLAALQPDGVRIYPTVIIRDTPLYDMWLEGAYAEHSTKEAVEWCSEIVALFQSEGIPVIRLGLNPTDELSGGDAAGGAYHPAFGELVYSRMFLKKARELLKNTHTARQVVFAVSQSRVSVMTGQKRGNIEALKREFGIDTVKVVPQSELKNDEVRLISIEK